ncbi:Uncharacterized protein TCM_030651 [Theobroma cacao]|uniref:Uncharacterized protein n=1 Tax=Theobroma cacao TaxID=3641 RepID=A0A061F4S7_THECC|nr:Uncharacterized protein TCM_030651 [Theobroma cacao]
MFSSILVCTRGFDDSTSEASALFLPDSSIPKLGITNPSVSHLKELQLNNILAYRQR